MIAAPLALPGVKLTVIFLSSGVSTTLVGASGGEAPETGVKVRLLEAALSPTLVWVLSATVWACPLVSPLTSIGPAVSAGLNGEKAPPSTLT